MKIGFTDSPATKIEEDLFEIKKYIMPIGQVRVMFLYIKNLK